MMLRLPFPDAWKVAIAIPSSPMTSGVAEQEFFEKNTPVPEIETLAAMAELYQASSAVRSADYRLRGFDLKVAPGWV